MIKADKKALKEQVDAAADKAQHRPRPSRCVPKPMADVHKAAAKK